MSKSFSTLAVVVGLSFSFIPMGSAHARPNNYQHHRFHHGYASPVYLSAPSIGPWEFVPGRDIIGESCGLPSSACSNNKRVTG